MISDINLPKSVKSLLWSYNLQELDLEAHKRVIISQVLNLGAEEAIEWLFAYYDKAEITHQANEIPLGQWDKKSLSLWSLILDIHPQSKLKKMSVV